MADRSKTKCPMCGKPSDFNAPPLGLFCSDRCKLLDLGRWLGGDYCVSEPLRPDHLQDYEKMTGEQLDRPGSE